MEYYLDKNIDFAENDKRPQWTAMHYAYEMWTQEEFCNNYLYIVERRDDTEHYVYSGMNLEELLLYSDFLDIKEVKLHGKRVDCNIFVDDNLVRLTYYDKFSIDIASEIMSAINNVRILNEPFFYFKTSFYCSGKETDEKNYRLIKTIAGLEEVNIEKYGINICNRKGSYDKYFDLNVPMINLRNFFYYDRNVFIGLLSETGLMVVYGIQKNSYFEILKASKQ